VRSAGASSSPAYRPSAAVASAAPVQRTPTAEAPVQRTAPVAPSAPVAPGAGAGAGVDLKDAFLSQVKAGKVFFYNTVVAQAYRVDVTPATITFTFLPNQRVPKQQCEDGRAWLESVAEKVAGRRIPVTVAVAETVPSQAPAATATPGREPKRATDEELRQEAMTDPAVQALFEIFPVEKAKIEEM
jgi:hypothetical protein